MFKRPLVPVAIVVLIISFLIIKLMPSLIYPDFGLADGDKVSIVGKIYKIENKDYSVYLYAVSGGHRLILSADYSLFEELNPHLGNTVSAECVYKEFNEARNLGNYDEKSYYQSLGIYQKYKIKEAKIQNSSISILPELLRSLNKQLEAAITASLPENETACGIIVALITGNKSGIDEESKELYSEAGIAHILAISGLHISFVGMGIYRIMRKKFRFGVSAAASIFIMICYLMMSGCSASAQRAVIMLIVRLGAIKAGKQYDMLSAISLAMILLLADNPFYAVNSGFQLSFAAVTALALIPETASEFLLGKIAKDKKRPSGKMLSLAKTFISGFSITLATLPIVASVYFEYPLYSSLLNLLVIPLISYVLAGSLAGGAAAIISKTAGRFVLAVPVFLVHVISGAGSLSRSLPGAAIVTGKPEIWKIIIYYVMLVAAVTGMKISNARRQEKLTKSARRLHWIAASAAAALCMILIAARSAPSGVEIHFVDVDQGKCIIVRTHTGTTYMFDAGSTGVDDVFKYRIESTLQAHGISRIDYMIVTHPDEDHISGLLEMLDPEYDGITIKNILIPDFSGEENYETIVSMADAKNIKTITVYDGLSLKDSDITFRCIYPEENENSDDANNMSAVFLLTYGQFSALFTGDIGSEAELKILERGELAAAMETIRMQSGLADAGIDILDVAHHGSQNSSCSEFLEEISPSLSVISAGIDNSYGHPHADTLERLKAAGSDIMSTQDYGEIDIYADRGGEDYTCSSYLSS